MPVGIGLIVVRRLFLSHRITQLIGFVLPSNYHQMFLWSCRWEIRLITKKYCLITYEMIKEKLHGTNKDKRDLFLTQIAIRRN